MMQAHPSDATTLPATVAIKLDGQPLHVPDGCSLAQLLSLLGQGADGVATALNGRHVPRDARPGTALAEGDQVLLFRPIVGG